MKKLYVFDMDGTLLPGTTGTLEIAKELGQLDLLAALEKEYYEKRITNTQFAKAIFDLWTPLSPSTVKKAFAAAPKLTNIEKVLKEIANEGSTSCLITASPRFFADHFYDFGFDYIFASDPFSLDQAVDRLFFPERVLYAKDKPLLAEKLCQEKNLPFEATVAFGDSHSDSALFERLCSTVSVNGDHHINALARHHYVGSDLFEAFAML
jgi:phosphoserine phosphatase